MYWAYLKIGLQASEDSFHFSDDVIYVPKLIFIWFFIISTDKIYPMVRICITLIAVSYVEKQANELKFHITIPFWYFFLLNAIPVLIVLLSRP
jgi:hypothetical protein